MTNETKTVADEARGLAATLREAIDATELTSDSSDWHHVHERLALFKLHKAEGHLVAAAQALDERALHDDRAAEALAKATAQ